MNILPLEFTHPVYNILKLLLDIYKGIIAGGAARQIFLTQKEIVREKENFGNTGIDIFFTSLFYRNKFSSAIGKFAKRSYDNAGSGKHAETFIYNGIKIQVINNTYKDISAIFEDFDFTCCQFAIMGNSIFYTELAEEDAINKILRYNNLPIRAIKDKRIIKYVLMKGYTPIDKLQDIFDRIFKQALNNEYLNIEEWAGIKREYNNTLIGNLQYLQGIQNHANNLFIGQGAGIQNLQWHIQNMNNLFFYP